MSTMSDALRGSVRRTCVATLATGALLLAASTPALATSGHGHGNGHGNGHGAAGSSSAAHGKSRPNGKATESKGKAAEGHGEGASEKSRSKASGRGEGRGEHRGAPTGSTRRPAADPRGNNGTVKIDGPAYGSHPGNEAHVACEFELEFFGFDAGQRADLTLTAHAPTRGGVVWQRDAVLISDDAAGGAGRDVDATVGPITDADLALDGITSTEHGYHLKLTVDVLGAPGAGKHKVFWLEPCAAPAPVPAATPTAGPAVGGAETGAASPEVPAASPVPTPGVAGPAPAVLGEVVTRDGAPAAVLAAEADRGGLPVTGVKLAGLVATGLVLLLGGLAAYTMARRTRRG
jgi:hypothetical protein